VLSQIVIFSPRSTIPSDQRRWRNEVVNLMARQGFVNYAGPWGALFAAGCGHDRLWFSRSAALIVSPTEYR
jgi:hypothetical protein